jgi:hypothetical protein
MASDKLLKKHSFCLNPRDNGGESLMLVTKMYSNGDPGGVYWHQELTLQSYCNSATFNLYGISLNPEMLRKLADELELANKDAEASCE